MEQKLIFIDLESNVLNFYNIKIEKNNKKYYIIVTTGKIGNKGTTSIVYESSDYVYTKTEFWKRVNDKKNQNYKPLKDVVLKVNDIFKEEDNRYKCDLCKKELDKRLYYKIDKYLRNETTVDKEKDNPICEKVACFECQSKYGVYKGKMGE